MELTIGVCVGSSIQIAAFVIPLLVIIGWMWVVLLWTKLNTDFG